MRVETGFLQVAQTTGNGTNFPCAHLDGLVVYIRSNGTTTAGAVTIEEDQDGTATTWSTVVTVPTSPVTVTGANNVFGLHLNDKCYGNIRARISTTVTGGTVTVTATGRRDT